MRKVMLVAGREYFGTVATKAFVFGILITPIMLLVMALVFPRLMTDRAPRVEGEIAIVDPTGGVTQGVRAYLDPEAMVQRREESARQALDEMPADVRNAIGGAGITDAAADAMAVALGDVPMLDVVDLAPTVDVEREKQRLADEMEGPRRLALVVVHDDAVAPPADGSTYGTYDLFVGANFDERVENEIHRGLRDAIVDARVLARDLDREAIEAVIQVPRRPSVTITRDTERETSRVFNRLVPAAFGALLFIAVIISGQSLLTTTVEEKASRVVEVLLSAVSPLELMTGKILGQLGVGLTVLGLYVALGVMALLSFAMLDLIDLGLVFYLLIFFVLTYLVYGSLMAAVGAAVNDMREAQSLMTPIMIAIMIPWMLWAPITQNPNAVFSITMSFVPPVNTFAMLLRMTSTAPPPWWQVWLTMVIGAAAVVAALWFAAKVFRVGLLMYGKPPNFATLVRWVRMA